MASPIPLREFGQLPEHGRIRTGIKSGRKMQALDTFRFTSPDRDALEQLAARYGGEVRVWRDPKANPPDQFEVITTSSAISVTVQPSGVDVGYELWTGGGRQRRCDGENTTLTVNRPDGIDYTNEPCICFRQGVLECKPKTRVQLIIPDINFAGTWRYESSGMGAAATIPSMMHIIEALQGMGPGGLLPVEMHLVKRSRTKGGLKRNWTEVQFRTSVTVEDMVLGTGTLQAQLQGGSVMMAPALTAGSDPDEPVARQPLYAQPRDPDDDDIADAELVDDREGDGEDSSRFGTAMTKAEAMELARTSGRPMKKLGNTGWTVG